MSYPLPPRHPAPREPDLPSPTSGGRFAAGPAGRLWTGRPAGIPVNKFVLEKGDQHMLMLYWYQNDRNVWAEEFQGKLRLLPDLIKYKRSDVSLVRLVELLRGDDASQALTDLTQFSNLVFPALTENFRRAD